MILLVWILNILKNKNKRANGLILLLLLMVTLYSFKFIPWEYGPTDTEFNENLFVQVGGDIKHPGVYSFSQGPKLKELVERAGGFDGSKGCLDGFEDSMFQSGDRVDVFWNGKNWVVTVSDISSFHKLTLGIPISLNSETEVGLTAIPGIGPKLARNIIEEKDRRGGFKKLRDLMAVPGINEKKYYKIVPCLIL